VKKRPVTPIKDPTLFEMGELEEAGTLANSLKIERPYSEPGLFLGTSAFTAAGWPGSFYPVGMKAPEYLKYYATSFIPRPWEMKEKVDLVTTDFLYVRWLGDRHGIEKITQTWDKTVVDRKNDLKKWAEVLRWMVFNKDIRKMFAFANNHYAGHGPATVKMFWDLWEKK
jgi:uncharacterized protein YecE (DUF72 family)